ncbi:uncharacterized protein GGS22DRAFT_190410 [Annulohypoxylon maeteangense]|uniref:uncharacterized protein n=1 Tax=Annulohypoxylon maeteangense TaxID=1927788 RepID=UPI0020085BD6|nr:uncharacterized protein GGS22DRAFT_190410 [Annulohypoxylon maeteangense]KAI0883103.1 hypothetical protein GGS22DRAFT_190410 [Annulohypoxylon maeteangense]
MDDIESEYNTSGVAFALNSSLLDYRSLDGLIESQNGDSRAPTPDRNERARSTTSLDPQSFIDQFQWTQNNLPIGISYNSRSRISTPGFMKEWTDRPIKRENDEDSRFADLLETFLRLEFRSPVNCQCGLCLRQTSGHFQISHTISSSGARAARETSKKKISHLPVPAKFRSKHALTVETGMRNCRQTSRFVGAHIRIKRDVVDFFPKVFFQDFTIARPTREFFAATAEPLDNLEQD